jgi:HEPN domain-containing protein
MNSLEIAEAYLKEARIRIKYAELSLNEDKDYAFCVRICQEAVELSIKACLRLVGIEYPKTHDPGKILLEHSKRFPSWLRNEVNNIADIFRWLRAERDLQCMVMKKKEYLQQDCIQKVTVKKHWNQQNMFII